MENQPTHDETIRAAWSTRLVRSFAWTGNCPTDVPLPAPNAKTELLTNAPVAETHLTELKRAVEERKLKAYTPYHPSAWEDLLAKYALSGKYPGLVTGLQTGFDFGIRGFTSTYAPPNGTSTCTYPESFRKIIDKEFTKGRYIGPVSASEVELLLGGHFQSSPLSLVDKTAAPLTHRMVQNYSHPHTSTHTVSSINSSIDSNRFPCTYGTFFATSNIIWSLPPGSEAAVRDVAEAFRGIPVHPLQWPGMVVRLSEDSFAVDTNATFGLSSAPGTYGQVADAGADIMRASGIGPMLKWVDDHIFFRVPRTHIQSYNHHRFSTAQHIHANGGMHHVGGRLFYKGPPTMAGGRTEEYDEDHNKPILDLSLQSER